MMKKKLLTCITISALVLFSSCTTADSQNNNNQNNNTQDDNTSPLELTIYDLGLTIEFPTNEAILNSTLMHTVSYADIRELRDGFVEFPPAGDSIFISTNVPLKNFEIITKTNEIINNEVVYTIIDTFGLLENFIPGQLFIITHYKSVGTIPHSGITFLDETDKRWYFSISKNQSGIGSPFFLIPFNIEA